MLTLTPLKWSCERHIGLFWEGGQHFKTMSQETCQYSCNLTGAGAPLWSDKWLNLLRFPPRPGTLNIHKIILLLQPFPWLTQNII